jgi:homeodomain-containing protein/Homeodomain-like domain-containing protein
MPWPKASPLAVSPRQRYELERLCRARTTPHAVVTRARIVCAAADGTSTSQIAQRWGLSRNTVQLWRERWDAASASLQGAEAAGAEGTAGGPAAERAEGVLAVAVRAVLADAPRPGTPPTFTPEQLCQIIAVACEPPGDSGRPLSQWTPRELADEAVTRGIVERISARTVGRFLVSGRGRAQAPPHAVLAHAARAGGGAGRLRGAGARDL